MPTLTDRERVLLKSQNKAGIGPVRTVNDWREMLKNLSSHDAAALILGDLFCYTAERRVNGQLVRRDGFLKDVDALAKALQAWSPPPI